MLIRIVADSSLQVIGLADNYRKNVIEYYSWFDESGEGFLHCTRECLVKKTGDVVEEELKKEVPNCERIEDVAFESHSSCYLQCNFCEACKTNKIALLRTFDFTDLIKPKPFHQVVEIATMCGTQCLY